MFVEVRKCHFSYSSSYRVLRRSYEISRFFVDGIKVYLNYKIFKVSDPTGW